MKWVKASERLPDKAGKYWTKYINHNGEQKTGSLFDGFKFPHHPSGIEWLDESPSVNDASVLKEALERIEKICLRDAVGIEPMQKHFRDIYELATTTLAQYNAVEPEKQYNEGEVYILINKAIMWFKDCKDERETLIGWWEKNKHQSQSPEHKSDREPEGIDEAYIRKFLIDNRVIRTELQDQCTQLLLLFYNHITRK